MSKCFVYGLFDPHTEEMFYVGKGTGCRDRSHLKPSMWKNPKDSTNPYLYYKIKSLMESDTPPLVKRLVEGITEEEAYDYENKIILEHGRRFSEEGGKLFNISEFKGGNKKGKEMPWTEERLNRHRATCKDTRIYDPTYDELYDEYITGNMLRTEIAKKHNVSVALVKKRLVDFGIYKPKHLRYGKRPVYTCKNCAKVFDTSPSVHRQYCSMECYHGNRKNNPVLSG